MATWLWVEKLMWWRKRDSTPVDVVEQSVPATLEKVFTPSAPAEGSYVSRPTQELDLRRALSAPGTQVVVYGESGAGKTSMTVRVLAEMGRPFVVTRCDPDTDYKAILASAFHQLNAVASAGFTNSDTRTLGISGGVPLAVEAKAEWELAQAKDFKPVVGAPVTAEFLAEQLGRRGKVWVIEDFHKTSAETKGALSHALKIFTDNGPTFPKAQVVVLGAADTPVEVWGTPNANLRDRLASVELPALNDDQLGELLDKGAALLNVDFSAVRHEIIRHSVGIAGVTQGLAFECCFASDVFSRQENRVTITNQTLATAKENYSRTRQVAIKDAFDKALFVKRVRRYNNHLIIVRALATLGEQGGTHAEIYAAIKERDPQYPSGNLTQYLRELQTEERGEVVRKTASGSFRFEKPLMHTYARQLFDIRSSGETFWSDIRASESDRDAAAESLRASNDPTEEG